MITVQINGKTRQQTVVSTDDNGAEKNKAALEMFATALAQWVFTTEDFSQKAKSDSVIRDWITVQNKKSVWHVFGLRASEDRVFLDQEQALSYAGSLGGKHSRAVMWLPAEKTR